MCNFDIELQLQLQLQLRRQSSQFERFVIVVGNCIENFGTG